jgi:predicted ArsR family transcriptional regulator
VTSPESTSEQAKYCAERWKELLDWLDSWFQPEKAETHDFDAGERELFNSLAPAWLAAEPGAAKIAALESASERFGRELVFALVEKLCADETRAHWAGLVREEGGSLDDLVRLLWEPLPGLGFKFNSERLPNSIQFRCTRCPHHELATRMNAADWLYAFVCATDPYVVEAFDPPIRFQRTKTLMWGDDHCDHAYFAD